MKNESWWEIWCAFFVCGMFVCVNSHVRYEYKRKGDPIAIAIAIDPTFFITRRRRRFDDDDDDDLNRTEIHTLSSSSHTYTNRRLFFFDTHKQTLRSTS
jgi:hypothetical protein